jgi:hypothetical protein
VLTLARLLAAISRACVRAIRAVQAAYIPLFNAGLLLLRVP